MLRVTDSAQAVQGLSKLWMPLGRRVVIVGGGLVGLELAEFLIARGREVTVLEPSDKPGRELAVVRRWRVLDAVKTHGTLQRQAQVSEITRKAVHLDRRSGHATAHAGRFGGAGPRRRTDDSVAAPWQAAACRCSASATAPDVGYIEGAMHDGHRVGRQV
jgi:predicted NAD/FAD-dependent oxidoreductase